MRYVLLPLLALAACVPSAPPPPPAARAPAPAPSPAPPPVPQDWQDGPVTPGQWSWRRDARGSVAMFGIIGRDAAIVVRCNLPERRISLTVPGVAAATLAITTTDGARSFTAVPAGGMPPYAGVTMPAADNFLDRIAYSRGRFRAALGRQPAIIVPSGAEFARTVEDCRA